MKHDEDLIRSIFRINNTTLQIKLDILDVYLGYRKGCRILCHLTNQIEVITKEIIASNLYIAVGKGLVSQSSSNPNNVKDYFDELCDTVEKVIPFYISQSKKYAEELRAADESKNDQLFGSMLDYPECCVNRVKEKKYVPSTVEAFQYLTDNQQFNIWTWPVAMIGDASLLAHYPCSVNCNKSIELAKKHFILISKFAPENIKNRVILYHKSFYSIKSNKISIDTENGDISPYNKLDEI